MRLSRYIHSIVRLVGLFITFLMLTPLIQNVQAQQFSFSLQPAQNHVIAKPGTTMVLPYKLTNTGDPIVVKLQPYILTVKDSTGSYELIPYHSDIPNFPQFNTSDAALKLGEPFLISSQEAIEFDLIVITNENIEEKDYYFTFVAELEPTEGFEDTSRIILQSGLGSNIYLSITKDGNIQNTGEVTQFNVQPQYSFHVGNRKIALFDSFQPIPISLTVANKGQRILQTSGSVSVHSSMSSETIVIPISEQYILANSQRLIAGSGNEGILSSDDNTAILPGRFIGAYSAQLALQIGDDSEQQIATVHYYVFPLRYSAYGLILLTILLLIPRLLRFKK